MGASEDHQSLSGAERRRKHDGDSEPHGDGGREYGHRKDRSRETKRRRDVEERESDETTSDKDEKRDKKRRRNNSDEKRRERSRGDKDEERRGRSHGNKDERRGRSHDNKYEERRGRSSDNKNEERRGRSSDNKNEEMRGGSSYRYNKYEERRGRSSHRDEAARYQKDMGREKPRSSVCTNEEKREVGFTWKEEKKKSGCDQHTDQFSQEKEVEIPKGGEKEMRSGCDLPKVHVSAPTFPPVPTPLAPVPTPASDNKIVTPYLMLNNVFDPSIEKEKEFYLTVQDDLHAECSRNALVVMNVHLVRRAGSLCFRFDSEAAALKAHDRFQDRELDGRRLSCSFLQKRNYQQRFGFGHNI